MNLGSTLQRWGKLRDREGLEVVSLRRDKLSAKRIPSRSRWSCSVFLILITAFGVASCSPTIARHEVKQTAASWSASGHQDSGILEDSKDIGGVPVGADWIAGYDSLLAKYGDTLTPPRKSGDREGITKEGDHYRITDATWERQLVLNQRRADDQAP